MKGRIRKFSKAWHRVNNTYKGNLTKNIKMPRKKEMLSITSVIYPNGDHLLNDFKGYVVRINPENFNMEFKTMQDWNLLKTKYKDTLETREYSKKRLLGRLLANQKVIGTAKRSKKSRKTNPKVHYHPLSLNGQSDILVENKPQDLDVYLKKYTGSIGYLFTSTGVKNRVPENN